MLCAIIFASLTMTDLDKVGTDVLAPLDPSGSERMEDNSGPGRKYPGPPKCKINGISVPAYVTCTEKGSITSPILVEILQHIDKLKILP